METDHDLKFPDHQLIHLWLPVGSVLGLSINNNHNSAHTGLDFPCTLSFCSMFRSPFKAWTLNEFFDLSWLWSCGFIRSANGNAAGEVNVLLLEQLTVLSFPLFLLVFNQLLVISLYLLVSPALFLSLQDSNQDGEKAGKEKDHNEQRRDATMRPAVHTNLHSLHPKPAGPSCSVWPPLYHIHTVYIKHWHSVTFAGF